MTKKIFNFTNFKWLMLFVSLTITGIMVLFFYQGTFNIGKMKDSSVVDLHSHQLDMSKAGDGGGVFRMKQLVITFVGGGALAFAGALLQKVTRNNLAEVSILGIGSINIMFIFAYIFIFKEKAFGNGIAAAMLPIVTLVASIGGTGFVWFVSRSKKANKNTFVIIGIATQLLFEALSVVFVNPSKLTAMGKQGKNIWNTIKNYTMGQVRVDSATPGAHPIPIWLIIGGSVVIALVIVVALFLRKKIDIYETNEHMATALGVKVGRLRLSIFMLVAVLAGVEATMLGTVALLGLIAPSIARLMFKNRFAPMAIASFIIGGMLVALASFISTNLGTNLPPGILATTIAAPYFIFLILRGK